MRNEVEIDAVVAYLFANSEDHEPAIGFPGRGNAANGQRIFESVGCLGCHIAGDETREEAGPRRTFGQTPAGHRRQDQLRVAVRLDPEPAPLQPRDVHAGSAAERLRGRRPRHLSHGADRRGRGRGGRDLRARGHRRGAAGLHAGHRAVRRGAGGHRRHEPRGAPARSRPAGDRALRLLQLPRDRRVRGCPAHRHRALAGRAASCFRSSTSRSFTREEVPHTKRDWINQKLLDPRIYDRGRIPAGRSRSCACPTSASPRPRRGC